MKYNFNSTYSKNDALDDETKNKKSVGNTLDFYNDNLSRKAVGKLFSESSEDESSEYENFDNIKEKFHSNIVVSNTKFEKDEKKEIYNIFSNSEENDENLLRNYIESLRDNKDSNPTKIKTLKETIEGLDEERKLKKQKFVKISLKNITILTSFIFLTIFIMLVQKVLSLNTQLNAYSQVEETFKQQIAELQLINNDLESLLEEMNDTNIQENIIDTDLGNIIYDTIQEETNNDSQLMPYTVQRGDNLWELSQKFYGNVDSVNIIKQNNNLQTDFLSEGQIINLPNIEGGIYGN